MIWCVVRIVEDYAVLKTWQVSIMILVDILWLIDAIK
jgi:hypothetical protein